MRDFAAGGSREQYRHRYSIAARASRMAMSPDLETLPNRAPFKCVLHQVGMASTRAPEGTKGHRVMVSREVTARRLPTLIGQALNVSRALTGHNESLKVGVITAAAIGRDPAPENGIAIGPISPHDVVISGHLYDKDFPDEVADIRAAARNRTLGASYEITRATIADPSAEVWQITDFCYTGAAALLRRSAAYEETRIAASSSGGVEENMALSNELRSEINTMVLAAVKAAAGELPAFLKQDDTEAKLDNEAADAKDKEADELDKEAGAMEAAAASGEVPEAFKKEQIPAGEGDVKCSAAVEYRREKAIDLRCQAIALRAPKALREPIRAMAKLVTGSIRAAAMRTVRASGNGKLVTDGAQGGRGLTTDGAQGGRGLTTDGADIKAAARRSLPSAAFHALEKGGHLNGNTVSEAAVDAVLAEAGVSDIAQRMSIKMGLGAVSR